MNFTTHDARGLSSGTLSYLINNTSYAVIDKVQAKFVKFCEEREGQFKNWKEAWKEFDKIRSVEPAPEFLAVPGEGAPQYTFIVDDETQLSLC